MKETVLRKLKNNREEFISGEELSEKFKVSRTTIWKIIKKLREEGYIIKSSTKKGYKLLEDPDLLTEMEISEYLFTKKMGKNIIYFLEVESTNDEMKKNLQEEEGTILVTENQILGKGRLGREWFSSDKKGIYFSLLLKPKIDPLEAIKITQIAASSLVEVLRKNNVEAYIKWPNDIILNNKKVAGILVEMTTEIMKIENIILGVGINVNTLSEDIPESLKEKATSLLIETGLKWNRKKLIGEFITEFEKEYFSCIENKNDKEIVSNCKKYSNIIGKKIKIIRGDISREVDVIDINSEGFLLVKNEMGEEEEILSGEISIRGLEGYI